MGIPHYGVARLADGARHVVVRRGGEVVDLAALAAEGRLSRGEWWRGGTLQPLLAAGPAVWAEVHEEVADALADAPALPAAELVLPWQVADYVDFYSSLHHAENVGRIFRPDGDPLLPNWKHLPIGYHGRAGTVVVSGTPVRRPHGPLGPGRFGATERLDVEVEVGFVVGVPSRLGSAVPAAAFRDHVFGMVVLNDWSARDVQSWEYRPLGPFLGKSFLTSVSPWVVPLAALDAALVEAPPQDPEPLPYLRTCGPQALDLQLSLRVNGSVVSRPRFRDMWWTPAQQLAHLTVNGAALRTGDLFASGTVSGPAREQRGCLLELTWGGSEPLTLDDGSTRTWLQDGDVVEIAATAPDGGGRQLDLGSVVGEVLPAGARPADAG